MKPSDVIARAVDAIADAFPEAIEVEGRVVNRSVKAWTNSVGRTYNFVNLRLVDLDATGSNVTLSVTTTTEDLDRILSRSGLDPVRVTAEGETIVVTGHVEGMRNSGMPQLRVNSIAPAGVSTDMLAVQALAKRIADERLGDVRHDVVAIPRVVRRVAVIGTPTGFADVRDGLRRPRLLPAPAICCHEINPTSTTAIIDVPRLIASHLDADVDAILIAFGGHLSIPSPWDSEPIIDAIVGAHRRGIAVLAGFAHAKDKPLAKHVAFDLNQASAAATRIVQRNDEIVAPLTRIAELAPRLAGREQAAHDQLRRAAQRTVVQLGREHQRSSASMRNLSRQQADAAAQRLDLTRIRIVGLVEVAAQHLVRTHQASVGDINRLVDHSTTLHHRHAAEQERLRRSAATVRQRVHNTIIRARRDLTAPAARTGKQLRRIVNAEHARRRSQAPASATAIRSRLVDMHHHLRQTARRLATDLVSEVTSAQSELRATSLVSQMLTNGWGIVTDRSHQPIQDPVPGDRIHVRTIHNLFDAIVTDASGDSS